MQRSSMIPPYRLIFGDLKSIKNSFHYKPLIVISTIHVTGENLEFYLIMSCTFLIISGRILRINSTDIINCRKSNLKLASY